MFARWSLISGVVGIAVRFLSAIPGAKTSAEGVTALTYWSCDGSLGINSSKDMLRDSPSATYDGDFLSLLFLLWSLILIGE
jgi:hypothetical protein